MTPEHNLLIVDDNPYVTGILVQNLKADFNITVANTGQDAARLLLQGQRFDCVLTELDLPFFSGLELTKLIRTNRITQHIPIVVLSNALDSEARIKCLEQGVDSYLSKPFNPLEVRAKLRAALRRATPMITEAPAISLPVPQPSENRILSQLKSRILSALTKEYAIPQSI